jgi:transposase
VRGMSGSEKRCRKREKKLVYHSSVVSIVSIVDELETLRKENREQAQEIRLLKQKIDLLVRQIYGSKSERLDPGQLDLLLGKEPEEEAESKKAEAPATPNDESGSEAAGAKPRRQRRVRLPEDLPVVEEVIEPEPVLGCPEAWRRIGEEVSELLDYEPGRFLRRRIIRPKYVRRADKEAAPLIAKLPEKVIEGGLPAPGLLTHIIVSKYADHLPLYRQQYIYLTRHEVHLPRQTLSRWVEAGADWCAPIYREMLRELKSGGYLQVDEPSGAR